MSIQANQLKILKRRWLRKRGEPMPNAILRLPFDRIHKAVIEIEKGNDVFVPSVPVTAAKVITEDSMMDWDHASNS